MDLSAAFCSASPAQAAGLGLGRKVCATRQLSSAGNLSFQPDKSHVSASLVCVPLLLLFSFSTFASSLSFWRRLACCYLLSWPNISIFNIERHTCKRTAVSSRRKQLFSWNCTSLFRLLSSGANWPTRSGERKKNVFSFRFNANEKNIKKSWRQMAD